MFIVSYINVSFLLFVSQVHLSRFPDLWFHVIKHTASRPNNNEGRMQLTLREMLVWKTNCCYQLVLNKHFFLSFFPSLFLSFFISFFLSFFNSFFLFFIGCCLFLTNTGFHKSLYSLENKEKDKVKEWLSSGPRKRCVTLITKHRNVVSISRCC